MIRIFSILLFVSALMFTQNSFAQTAVDFTADDCNANSHNLFTQLDSGKVIVMVFVMPCGSCVNPAITSYNIVQSFATSHPGRVEYFLCDDIGNSNCTTLNGWADNNSIGNDRFVFNNTSVNQNDYGVAGMPKVVVVAGTQHHVYFNENDAAAGNSINLQSAVQLALNETAIPEIETEITSNIFPNPSSDFVNVDLTNFNSAKVELQLMNSLGQIISEKASAGNLSAQFDVNALAEGIYFVKIISGDKQSIQKVAVSR